MADMVGTWTIAVYAVDPSNNPVSSASICVDGIQQGTTDSDGWCNVGIGIYSASETHQITATANGFSPFTTSVTVSAPTAGYIPASSSADQNLGVNFTALPALTSSPLTVTCTPASDGANANVSVVVGSNAAVTGTTDETGNAYLTVGTGSATVTVTKSGYNTGTSTVTVTGGSQATSTIQMVASTDAASQQSAATKATSTGASSTAPTVSPYSDNNPDPNWIPSNSSDGTYSTGNNARLYIGGLFIDEVSMVHFYLQDNKIPIYGYRSRFYDAMGQGRSLVQGGLSLNYVHEGYLYTALQNYQSTGGGGSYSPPKQDSSTADLVSINQSIQTLQTQIQGATGDTLTQLQGSLATAMAQQTAMLAALPATAVSSLKSILNSQPGRAQGQSQAVYTDIIFDIEVDINHNGRTMKRMIKGCVLTGNSQTYDNNGNVLTDDYSFIARQVQ